MPAVLSPSKYERLDTLVIQVSIKMDESQFIVRLMRL